MIMSQTSIARSLFTVGLLLGALGCSAGEESTPARTGHTLASVAAGTDNQAAAARTLKPDNQSALDRVAESIRSSYTRTTGGQVEQLVPILRDGLGAASDTAKPMGLGYDSGKGKYRSWLYTYAQTLAGLPVYGASLRIVVQDQPTNPAVWVSSTLRNLGSFTVKPGVQAPAVDSQEARQRLTERASAEGTARLPSPTRFGQPSLVIYAGDRDQPLPPRLATQYLAESDTPVGAWLVIADVDTGEVLHSHSTISAADVPGQVTMLVTPNDLGEYCSLVASTPMPYAKVGIIDGAQVFADANGQFTIPNSGTSPVEVVSSLEG